MPFNLSRLLLDVLLRADPLEVRVANLEPVVLDGLLQHPKKAETLPVTEKTYLFRVPYFGLYR